MVFIDTVSHRLCFAHIAHTQTALNGLKHTVVKAFDLPSDSTTGGINILLSVDFPNPSPFSIEMGICQFDILYNNTLYGIVSSGSPVFLEPGSNVINMAGNLLAANGTNGTNNAASTQFSLYISGATTTFEAVGNTVYPNIEWLYSAFHGLTTDVNVFGQPTQIVKNITIPSVGLTFDAASTAPTLVMPGLMAAISLPFGFGVNFTSIAESFNLTYNGNTFATVSTPWVTAGGGSDLGFLVVSLSFLIG